MSVAITGLGVACPLAVGHDGLWQRLLTLEPAVCDAPPSPAGLDVAPATAFAEDFPAEDYAPPRKVRKCSNLARLAVVAGLQSAEHAALPEDAELRDEVAVVLGTCFGSSDYYLKFHEGIRRKGVRAANSVLFTEGVFNSAPGHLCQLLKLRGPGLAVVGGEECGLSSILIAADRVLLGSAKAALAGGCEEFCDRVQGSLLSEGRVGRTLGGLAAAAPSLTAEGAATVCLEPLAAAQARGATVHARLLGGARARSGDPSSPDSLVRAARAALAAAGREPNQVDLVVGGACGGDGTTRELAALGELFASRSPSSARAHRLRGDTLPPLRGSRLSASAGTNPWYCAPKALVGEGFAFTSSLLAVVGTLALSQQTVPPTFSGDAPLTDAGPLRVADAPQAVELKTVLVLGASAPGGAVALVLGA